MLAAEALTEMDRWEMPSYEPRLPVTEKSNPRTRELDRARPEQLVRSLRDCDSEIFQHLWGGGAGYQGLYSDSIVQTIVHVAKKVEDILKNPEGRLIVLSGCGTSGRLAYLLATSFNRLLTGLKKERVLAYIIAGGDKALLTSQEAPEDDPQLGALNLEQVCTGKSRVLFIGISCGLSAPFVAGQLDFCMNHLDVFTPVLLGFNPVDMARNEPVPGWALTFRAVAERMLEMQKTHRAFIINPAVGPEPISGSSRMKAGSTTKILLETLLWSAHTSTATHRDVLKLLKNYEHIHRVTYSQSEQIAALVKQAGASLQKGGHVYYVGWGTLGVIGIIDASECVPTFGAEAGDICGFISEGYTAMGNTEGDMTSLGPEFCIGHKDFVSAILPNVRESDSVIFMFTLADDLDAVGDLALCVKQKTSNLHAVAHAFGAYGVPDRINRVFASILTITWPRASEEESSFLMTLQVELATKWVLNAVSTGAHILKGKVYRNYMMDLKVTNSKLFRRAVSLLQMFSGCAAELCHGALIRAVYSTDQPTEEMSTASLTEHAQTANTCSKVVPTALMMLRWKCSVREARARLQGHMIIRDAVESCLTA
ncbi:glucokinase regulatory protein isoform X2 [Conger conger]|uniref:glucokinase regulatory protein isoform X2 n=1 Tax=Conger conger TaxID=82655 RepID=UPI002A5A1153|nr:glucokinase regulatory protein isoform X2 [Conger conger]